MTHRDDGAETDDPTVLTPMGPRPLEPPTGNPRPVVAIVIVVSWVMVLVISAIPSIISVLISGTVPYWLQVGQIVTVVALLLLSLFVPTLRPLWRFASVAGALLVFVALSAQIDFEIPALQTMLGDTPFDQRMQAEQTAKIAVTLGMISVLLLLKLKPRDFFLTVGNLTARIRPVPALGFPKPDSWRRFGLIWGFGIAAAIAVVETVIVRPDASQWSALLPMIPSILVYAAFNAFSEEMTYRAPLLATLEPSVGERHALWQTAIFFAVAHYFGIPGGMTGAVLSIFMGWILSKAMLETRGLFWSWWIHFLSDVVIFCFIGLALVS